MTASALTLRGVRVMSDIEREEFEQAVTDRWSDSYSFTRFGDEDYYDEVLEGMWWAWQASREAPVAWWDGDSEAFITRKQAEAVQASRRKTTHPRR